MVPSYGLAYGMSWKSGVEFDQSEQGFQEHQKLNQIKGLKAKFIFIY